MRDKGVIKQKRFRILYTSFLLIGIVIGILIAALFAGNQYLQKNRVKIETEIKSAFGFPVVFQNLSLEGYGFSVGLTLTDFLVSDGEVPVPFLAIRKIKFVPSLKALIVERKLQFRKIEIEGLNIVAAWDRKKGLTLLGLKGEIIPGTFEYNTFMTFMHQYNQIEIKNSNIEWRLENFHFKQFLTGEFSFLNTTETDWTFVGEHQWQFRNSALTPSSSLNLAVAPRLEKISAKMHHSNHLGHCDFLKVSEGWEGQCAVKVENLEVAGMHEFYRVEQQDPEWLVWLNNALKSGKITEGTAKIQYAARQLDWNADLQYEAVGMIYAPQWPMITQAEGKVQFDPKKVSVQVVKGNILDANIGPASILIGSLQEAHPIIQVEGSIESRLETGTLFLKKSPLDNTLAKFLEPLALTGPMDLDLKLRIPLTAKAGIKLDGLLFTKDAQLTLPETNISLSSVQGRFHFTESLLEATNFKGNLLDQNFDIVLNTRKNLNKNYLQVIATGPLNADFFQKQFDFPLLEKLQGSSIFSLAVQLPLEGFNDQKERMEWRISSNLQGMAILLPGFMGKKSEDKQAFSLSMDFQSEKKRMNIHAEKLVDAKIIFGSRKNESGANVVFGSGIASWPSLKGLSVRGEISALNVEDWLDFFASSTQAKKWFESFDLKILANHLEYQGFSFNKIEIASQVSRTPLKWELSSDSIEGTIYFQKENQDKMFIHLDHLRFEALPKIKGKTRERVFSLGKLKKEIFFECQNIYYAQKDLGRVSFQLIPKHFGYEIKGLTLENNFSELRAEGEWHIGKSNQTLLTGTFKSTNMGNALLSLGYLTALRDGNGRIDYQLKWNADPFQVKPEILEGNIEVKFDRGRILGLSPGIGRIVGLLSLENIQRRLRLDFSDLFKKGLVFDRLKGRFKFSKGLVHAESFNIESPSAKIEVLGQANLVNKAIDLDLVVTRHLSSAGFPVAAAIAAGPVAGAGVFIIDRLTGSKIDKMSQHRYKVTGTWDAPSIQESLQAR